MVGYTHEPTGFTTDDREEFIAHLMALDREGKEEVLASFWRAFEIEDSIGGDNLVIVSNDVIEYSEPLCRLWMNALLDDMEERVDIDEPVTEGSITVTVEDD